MKRQTIWRECFFRSLKEDKAIWIIAAVSLVARLPFLFSTFAVWWDSAVYVGMGKYLFSGGAAGLWEPLRPIGWPIMLGSGWALGMDPLQVGRILGVLLSVGCIVLVYLLGKDIFSKKTGIVAAALFALSPIFFAYGYRVLTDIPSTFFALLAFYCMIKIRFFLSGIFVGIAAMVRFPQGLLLVALTVAIIYQQKDVVRRLLLLLAGFACMLIPFLMFNYVMYSHEAFYPFIQGNALVMELGKDAGGMHLFFYFTELLKSSYLLLFSLVGIGFMLSRKPNAKEIALLALGFLLLVYFIALAYKEQRYVLVMLPYFYLLASYGLLLFWEKAIEPSTQKAKRFLNLFIVVTIGVGLFFNVWPLLFVEDQNQATDLRTYITEHNVSGPIMVSNPIITAYVNNKIIPFSEWQYVQKIYEENINQTSLLAFNSCDIPCRMQDCTSTTELFVAQLLAENRLISQKQDNGCQSYLLDTKLS